MKPGIKTALITTVCMIVAGSFSAEAPLGKLIWPAKPMQTPATDTQVLGFIAFTIVSAIVFGLGVSFLTQGYGLVRRITTSRRDAILAYASIGWILVSWFPHDNLHMAVGDQPGGILALLWGFHVTLMIAGLGLAFVVLRTARTVPIRQSVPAERTSPVAVPRGATTQPR